MKNAKKSSDLAQKLRFLANEGRLRIVRLLMRNRRSGPTTVNAISAELGVPQPTVSGHLAQLRHLGIVESHGQAGYQVNSQNLRKLFKAAEKSVGLEMSPIIEMSPKTY